MALNVIATLMIIVCGILYCGAIGEVNSDAAGNIRRRNVVWAWLWLVLGWGFLVFLLYLSWSD
jgi:hypothetical protein